MLSYIFSTIFPKKFQECTLLQYLPRKIFRRHFRNEFRECISFPRKRNLPKIFLRRRGRMWPLASISVNKTASWVHRLIEQDCCIQSQTHTHSTQSVQCLGLIHRYCHKISSYDNVLGPSQDKSWHILRWLYATCLKWINRTRVKWSQDMCSVMPRKLPSHSTIHNSLGT